MKEKLIGEVVADVQKFTGEFGTDSKIIITFASGKSLTVEVETDEDFPDEPLLGWVIQTPLK